MRGMLWRIVTDPVMSATLSEVKRWSYVDLVEAHLVLDSVDEQRRYAEAQRNKA